MTRISMVKAIKTLPTWEQEIGQELDTLLKLPENWNSYHARPIRHEAVAAAKELLHDVSQADTPRPLVTPTVRGGVQLEWHTRGIDLEIELEVPGQFQVLFEDLRENVTYEAHLGSSDTPRLAELVGELSR